MSIDRPFGGGGRFPELDADALSLLSDEGRALVVRAVTDPHGAPTDSVRELGRALEVAAQFERLVLSGGQGDRGALRQLTRFSLSFPPRDFGSFGFCPVSPLSPAAFLWAGLHIAGSLDAERQIRRLWDTYRATLGEVAARVEDVGRFAAGDPGDRGPWRGPIDLGFTERLGGVRSGFGVPLPGGPLPGGPLPGGPPLPERPLPCFTEQELCLGEILDALQELRRTPRPSVPTIGAISPPDTCVSNAPLTVVLTPAAGTTFPATQADLNSGSGGSLALVMDGQLANILNWTSTAISIEIPAGFAPGCHEIGWLFVPDATIGSRLEAVGQQCGRYYYGAAGLGSFNRTVVFAQAELTVIGAPRIESFSASKPNAESCEVVELAWRVELLVCGSSQASVRVSLLENGTIVQDYLPLVGTAAFDRASSASYALVATSMLGAQQCATTQAMLSVSRTAYIRATGPTGTCLDLNTPTAFQITCSCPAPAGGLPVTVTSSDPSRFPSSATRIDEGLMSVDVVLSTGYVCGDVALTFAAPGHTSATLNLKIGGTPTIASLSQTNFQTCRPIEFAIAGTCLGDSTTAVRVRLESGGAPVASGVVTVLAAHTQLQARFDPRPAGSYVVIVESCGRAAAAPVPIVVTQATPTIFSFTVTPASADLCDSSQVRLRWRVSDASSVVIRAGTQMVATRVQTNPCAVWEEEVTVSAGLGQTVFELTASVPGTSASRTATAPFTRISAITTIASLTLANQSGRNLVLWALVGASGSMLGSLASGQTQQIQLTQCVPLIIVAVDPVLVSDHNTNFNDNLQPSELRVAQNPRFRRWQSGATVMRFHPTGQPVGATIL